MQGTDRSGDGYDVVRSTGTRGSGGSMDLRARLKAAEVRGGATQPLRDIICEVFGHRNIWGPDQDGRTICAFCHTVLSFGRPARRKAP